MKKSDPNHKCKKPPAKEIHKKKPSLINSCSKQSILSVISSHSAQIKTFESKIRPFSKHFAQKSPILDQSLRKSDNLGTLHENGYTHSTALITELSQP